MTFHQPLHVKNKIVIHQFKKKKGIKLNLYKSQSNKSINETNLSQ